MAGNVPIPQRYAARRIPGEDRRRVGFASLGFPLLIPDPFPFLPFNSPLRLLESSCRCCGGGPWRYYGSGGSDGGGSEVGGRGGGHGGDPSAGVCGGSVGGGGGGGACGPSPSLQLARPAAPASPPRRRRCRPCRFATPPSPPPSAPPPPTGSPAAAAGLPVGMAAVSASVVAVAASGVCQARLRRKSVRMKMCSHFMSLLNRIGWTCGSRRMGLRVASDGPADRVRWAQGSGRFRCSGPADRVASDGPAGRVGWARGSRRMGPRVA